MVDKSEHKSLTIDEIIKEVESDYKRNRRIAENEPPGLASGDMKLIIDGADDNDEECERDD